MKQIMLNLLLFLFFQNLNAQINMRYNIGSIGNMGDIDRKYSGPYYIPGNECFNVANGVKTLFISPRGNFSIACPEKNDFLYILVYPNPGSSIVTVKAIYTKTPDFVEYTIKIVDMIGEIRKIVKTNSINIKNGEEIPIYMLPNGYYAIVISTLEIIKSIQFIKN